MALFSSKKNKTQEAPVQKTESAVVQIGKNLDGVLIQPRITEKASFRTDGNVYTFEVATRANKKDVAQAVAYLYNVKPVRVNIAQIPSKRTFTRGKWGVKKGGKKAYVFLKKGDSIEIS